MSSSDWWFSPVVLFFARRHSQLYSVFPLLHPSSTRLKYSPHIQCRPGLYWLELHDVLYVDCFHFTIKMFVYVRQAAYSAPPLSPCMLCGRSRSHFPPCSLPSQARPPDHTLTLLSTRVLSPRLGQTRSWFLKEACSSTLLPRLSLTYRRISAGK